MTNDARLFRKREALTRLAQCSLLTDPGDAFGRVAIDVRIRSLDRQICRMEHTRSLVDGLAWQ